MTADATRWGKVGPGAAGKRIVRAVLVALALAGCQPSADTARGIAERFLDAHYVRIDLAESRPYTSGLARHKVDQEVALTSGQPIDENTRVPRVHYKLREERPRDADTVSFEYEATISVDDGGTFERMIQLTVRREADGWRVSNYQEY